MKKALVLMVSSSLLLCTLFTGCGNDVDAETPEKGSVDTRDVVRIFSRVETPQDKITGKWLSVNGVESLEFYQEGTIVCLMNGREFNGDYKFIKEDTLRIDLKGNPFSHPLVGEIKFHDNIFILRTASMTCAYMRPNEDGVAFEQEQQRIVGKWEGVKEYESSEFFEDGRLVLKNNRGLFSGTYNFVSQDVVVLNLDHSSGQKVYNLVRVKHDVNRMEVTSLLNRETGLCKRPESQNVGKIVKN